MWFWVALSYLVGSVSFGLIAAKRADVDLRAIGSGNIGATNVTRALGKRTGRLVMLLDALKGFIPAALARFVFDLPGSAVTWIGWAAAFGHCFPIWHGLRGGKGAATSAGVLLGALPPIGLLTAALFVGVKKLSRRASVASLTAAGAAAIASALLYGDGWKTRLCLGLFALIVIRHRDNIGRLIAGTEPTSEADAPDTEPV